MPARNNKGIVTIRDVMRTAVAMELLSKHARNSERAVFSMWSAPQPLLCNGAVNISPGKHISWTIERLCFMCGPCRGVTTRTKKIVWNSWVSISQPARIWAWEQRNWIDASELLSAVQLRVESPAEKRRIYVCRSTVIFGVCDSLRSLQFLC
jgi:hypothetical protein